MLYACIATPLDHYFLIIGGVARSLTKLCISTIKYTIDLKLECGFSGRIVKGEFKLCVQNFQFATPISGHAVHGHTLCVQDSR